MKKECDGFFEAYGITPAQEELFEAIYRRRQIYRRIIGSACPGHCNTDCTVMFEVMQRNYRR